VFAQESPPAEPPEVQPKEEPKEQPKEEPKKPAEELKWLKSIDEAKKKAKEAGAKIFLLFTSPTGCPPCDILKGQTFHDEDVKSLLKTFVLVKINAWDRGPGGAEAQKWGVRGIPTMALLDSDGKEIGRKVGYMDAEKFIEAFSNLRDADLNIEKGKKKIEADASDPAGYLRAARGYAARGKADEAQKNFEKAVELDPKNEKGAAAEAYEKMAGFYADAGKFDKAVEAAQKLNELDPENKKGLAIKSAEMLSAYYGAQRNLEKAIEYADKIIELDPENKEGKGLEVALGLGKYYAGRGDAENAKKYFDIVKKMDPENKEGHADSMELQLACVPAGKRKFDEAIKNVEKFIETHKESDVVPNAYFELARFHYRAGDVDKTREVFQELIKKFPDSDEAKQAKQILPRLR
jgi:tetratricopeptide (TPR) repeat protein